MKVKRSDALKVCHAVGLKAADKWPNDRMAKKLESLPELKDKVKASVKDKDVKNLLEAMITAVEEEKGLTIEDDVKTPKKGAPPSKNGKPKAGKGKKVEEEEEEEEEEETDEEEEEDEEEEGPSDEELEEEEETDEETEDESEEEEEETDEEEEEEKPKKKGKKGAKGKKPKAAKKTKTKVEKDRFGNRLGTRTARINAAMSAKPKTIKEIEKEAKARSIHSHIHKLMQRGFIKKVEGNKYRMAKK